MSPLVLIIKEIAHHKANAVLSLLAITIAVGGSIVLHTAFEGSLQRTKRIQRDMGQNLRIVSKDTDLAHFWDEGYSKSTFPDEWIQQFTNVTKEINYSHLSAVLKWKIDWRGSCHGLRLGPRRNVGPEKTDYDYSVKQGTVQLGKTLAAIHEVKRDDTVKVESGEFSVARVLSEKGSGAEIRIYMHLKDAQSVLGRKGLINEIQALDCYCADESQDTLALLRKQLAPILPQAQVFRMQDMAEAREKQRRDIEWTYSTLMPAIVMICGIIIGLLAFLNTRARRQEIGILRALGKGSPSVATLFLGKALVLGVVGAACGFGLGTVLLMGWGQELLRISPKLIGWDLNNLKWALLLAPVFAALAIPAMLAVVQDPADTLRHD